MAGMRALIGLLFCSALLVLAGCESEDASADNGGAAGSAGAVGHGGNPAGTGTAGTSNPGNAGSSVSTSGSSSGGTAPGGSASGGSAHGGTSSAGGTASTGGSAHGGMPDDTAGGQSNGGATDPGGEGGAASGDLVDCNPAHALCRSLPPDCGAMEVPRINGTCWGDCVDIAKCACSAATECPNNNEYTCWRKQHCGPYLQ
jgi:hypothetical protein